MSKEDPCRESAGEEEFFAVLGADVDKQKPGNLEQHKWDFNNLTCALCGIHMAQCQIHCPPCPKRKVW